MVAIHALSFVGGRSRFRGWTGAAANQGIAAAGKNNVSAFVDTALRRYAGIAFPAPGINNLESSTKAAPTVWAVPNALPVAALSIQDMYQLPGVSPDTLLVATSTAADGRLYKFVLGTGWTNLAFPDGANSDGVQTIAPTSDPDLFLIGNQCRNVAGSPQLWTFRLSTVTWTKVAGTGLNGSWTFTNNNGAVNEVLFFNNVAWVIVGNGTANGLQVWRSDSLFTTWTQIGGNALFGSWATGTKRNGRITFAQNNRLYASIGGGTPSTDAEVWECTNPGGATPAWVEIGNNTQWTSATITNASKNVTLGNKLLIGTSGSANGDAQLWQFDLSTRLWTQYTSPSPNRRVTGSLYVSPYDNQLFVGLGDNSTGTAQLFQIAPTGPVSRGGAGFQFSLYKNEV